MPRILFRFRVRPEALPEYRARHAAVWPELLRDLHAAGWRDYSIFTADDGLVIGTAVVDDPEATDAAMARSEANARWQREMAAFFDGAGPDERLELLDPAFHLETQLAAATRPAPSGTGPRDDTMDPTTDKDERA